MQGANLYIWIGLPLARADAASVLQPCRPPRYRRLCEAVPLLCAEPKKSWCSTRIVSHALPFIVILLQQTLKIKFVMEVITFESEAYKSACREDRKIAEYVAAAQLPSEEKKEAWLDSNQLAEALGISTRTLQRLRDENLISYSMLRGRCMYKLSEVERCLEERTIRCKPQTLEDFRKNYLTRIGNDKKG